MKGCPAKEKKLRTADPSGKATVCERPYQDKDERKEDHRDDEPEARAGWAFSSASCLILTHVFRNSSRGYAREMKAAEDDAADA